MNRDERLAAVLARRRTDQWALDGWFLAAENNRSTTDLPSDSSGLGARRPATKKEGTHMKFTFEIEPERLATAEALHFSRTAAKLATFEGSAAVFDQLGRTLRIVLRDAIGGKLAGLVIDRLAVVDGSVEDAVGAVLGASLKPAAKPRTKVVGAKKAAAKTAKKAA